MPPCRCPHLETAPAAGSTTLGAGTWRFASPRAHISVLDRGGPSGDQEVVFFVCFWFAGLCCEGCEGLGGGDTNDVRAEDWTSCTTGGGGAYHRAIGRLPPTFQPISGRGGGGGGGWVWGGVWGRLKGRGAPGPQHIWLKMTPSSR